MFPSPDPQYRLPAIVQRQRGNSERTQEEARRDLIDSWPRTAAGVAATLVERIAWAATRPRGRVHTLAGVRVTHTPANIGSDDALLMMAHALAADGAPPAPLAVTPILDNDARETPNRVMYLRTSAEWRDLLDRWIAWELRISNRGIALVAWVHDEVKAAVDQSRIDHPTDQIAQARVVEAACARVVPADVDAARALLDGVRFDPPAALPTDLDAARGVLMDRVERAAREWTALIVDGPHGQRPANVAQRTAEHEVAARRNTGRHGIRAATSRAAATAAASLAISRIWLVSVAGAPTWSTTGLRPAVAGRVPLTPPAARPWACVVDSRPASAGSLVVETRAPDGWTVAVARIGDGSSQRVTISHAAPSPGDHDFDLLARNEVGPAILRLRLVVRPEAA